MKVLAIHVGSGKGSKKNSALSSSKSTSISSSTSRFRNGSSFGIGRPTAGSLRSPKVRRYGRFYDEYGVGITVPRVNKNRVKLLREQAERDRKKGLPTLPSFLLR